MHPKERAPCSVSDPDRFATTPSHIPSLAKVKMPHVNFSDVQPPRRSYEETRAIVTVPKKKKEDKQAIVLHRTRTISYKIPEEKACRPVVKPVAKPCIERKIVYKDSRGRIVRITYEDSCGHVTKTVYPTSPPPPPKKECRPPSPPPKCKSPPISEPSNIPSEDVKNCDWTKIIVKNSRGVVWKIVHVDCYGKTMKTEYPEPEPPRRRSNEIKKYVIKEVDDDAPRRRYSETKKVVIDRETREPTPRTSSDTVKTEKKIVIDKEIRDPEPKPASDTTKTEKTCEIRSTVKSGNESARSEEHSDTNPSRGSATDSNVTDRRDSVTNSSSRNSGESSREVIKDENGVTRKVIYTDSRGRRRTVVYDDDD